MFATFELGFERTRERDCGRSGGMEGGDGVGIRLGR